MGRDAALEGMALMDAARDPRRRLVASEPGHRCSQPDCPNAAFVFDTLNGGDWCEDHCDIEALPGGRQLGTSRLHVHPSELDRYGRPRR